MLTFKQHLIESFDKPYPYKSNYLNHYQIKIDDDIVDIELISLNKYKTVELIFTVNGKYYKQRMSNIDINMMKLFANIKIAIDNFFESNPLGTIVFTAHNTKFFELYKKLVKRWNRYAFKFDKFGHENAIYLYVS